MISTGTSQTPLNDREDKGVALIATFTWDTTTIALSRYRSKFFLVHGDVHHPLEPGKRIHSPLNVVSWDSNRHSKKGPKVASFWLNCSQGNGDVDDPSGVFYQLIHADPPLVRRTGRKRKEVSAENGVSTLDCYEFEVLIPEEGLIRQCYYCLSWEDNERGRYSQIKDDKYWCSRCKKKGRFLSAITPKEKFGVHLRDSHHIERDSIYA